MRTMPAGPYPVKVSLCMSEAEWNRAVRPLWRGGEPMVTWDAQDQHTATNCIDCTDGSRWIVVACAPSVRDLPLHELLGMLAHEAVHVWQFVREHLLITQPDHETEAYNVQWYVQWLSQQLAARGWLGR